MKSLTISITRFILSISFMMVTLNAMGQTYYALQIDRNIRFKAADITAEYQPRLVMGADQALEFQQTVARFLVKKKAVEEDHNLSPKAKYELLKRVSSHETAEMADVLESYRWQEYMRIKPEIQPIPEPERLGGFQDAIVVIDTTNQ
ncbi:hypothetical protein [Maribacter arenosus]|uniref:Uncharacterized protein n=1 Tax=Maribacter arenosus TaxID=1854708 RepID=A0ABR7V7B6_9FLAO|nr:hypothetical protein [Maribacter arenosus]MBD0849589.1 hypothetical protein [Maribacter arenosus]